MYKTTLLHFIFLEVVLNWHNMFSLYCIYCFWSVVSNFLQCKWKFIRKASFSSRKGALKSTESILSGQDSNIYKAKRCRNSSCIEKTKDTSFKEVFFISELDSDLFHCLGSPHLHSESDSSKVHETNYGLKFQLGKIKAEWQLKLATVFMSRNKFEGFSLPVCFLHLFMPGISLLSMFTEQCLMPPGFILLRACIPEVMKFSKCDYIQSGMSNYLKTVWCVLIV